MFLKRNCSLELICLLFSFFSIEDLIITCSPFNFWLPIILCNFIDFNVVTSDILWSACQEEPFFFNLLVEHIMICEVDEEIDSPTYFTILSTLATNVKTIRSNNLIFCDFVPQIMERCAASLECIRVQRLETFNINLHFPVLHTLNFCIYRVHNFRESSMEKILDNIHLFPSLLNLEIFISEEIWIHIFSNYIVSKLRTLKSSFRILFGHYYLLRFVGCQCLHINTVQLESLESFVMGNSIGNNLEEIDTLCLADAETDADDWATIPPTLQRMFPSLRTIQYSNHDFVPDLLPSVHQRKISLQNHDFRVVDAIPDMPTLLFTFTDLV